MGAQIHGVLNFDETKRATLSFSEAAQKEIAELLTHYPADRKKSALLPVLHIAQAEFDGWLSPEVMDLVADTLGLQAIEVFEVASFYSMYNLKPVGKCVLEVCRTSSCWTRGADDIVDYISKKLQIKDGETTSDGMFTLKTVECLGSCGTAPMMQCGAAYHENLTEEKVDQIIEKYRAKGKRTTYTDLAPQHTK